MSFFQQSFTGSVHSLKGLVDDSWTGDEDHIPSRFDASEPQTHRLAQQSLGSVPLHRVAYAATGGEAKATVWKVISQEDKDS